MADSNIVVTKTVNRTTFEVDKATYNKTLKAIQSIKKEWEKAAAGASPKGAGKSGPAKQYDSAAAQIRKVNKRLAQTRAREEARESAQRIALAKKEARANQAIQKQSSARIRQVVGQMTAKSTDMNKMRDFYRQMEREAKKTGKKVPAAFGRNGPLNVRSVLNMPEGAMGSGTGMVGNKTGPYSPELVKRQNAQMYQQKITQAKADAKAQAKVEAAALRAARKEEARSARASDIVGQQRTRLSSTYGNKYASLLGKDGSSRGIMDLNREFKNGTISVGQYRQSISALERQFRSAQSGAASFSGIMHDVRSSLVGVTAAYGAFSAAASVLKSGQFFQGMEATMLMVSDGSEEAGKRIKFVREQSMRLGLSLKEASQGYTQMSIASEGVLSKSENDDLFKSFSEYSTALQVDPVRYQRGITAIQQMMGKGQIMAEELKSQLAEGIPGSLQVFVKATQEAFGDTTIDVEKLMDMMQKGQLKAAKILPFVAKYYAAAANKGGALDKALQSNRVALQRLQLTWMDFQNKIFQSKFGEVMTRVFNDLAKLLDNNGELATNIGSFFGNMIEGAWDAATLVHDAFVFLSKIIEHYAKEWGYQGDIMKDIFNWGAYVGGIALFIGGLSKILGILKSIAGLRGAIGGIRDALGGDLGGDDSGGGKGRKGGRKGGSPWGGRAKWGGLALGMPKPIPLAIAAAGTGYLMDHSEDAKATKGVEDKLLGGNAAGALFPLLWQNAKNWVTGNTSSPSPNIDTTRLSQTTVTTQNPSPYPLQQQAAPEGKITVEIKAGDLKQYIKAVVDDQDQLKINLLTQGGRPS